MNSGIGVVSPLLGGLLLVRDTVEMSALPLRPFGAGVQSTIATHLDSVRVCTCARVRVVWRGIVVDRAGLGAVRRLMPVR